MSKFYIRMYKDGRRYRTAGCAGSAGANMHHLEMILRALLDCAQDHPDGHISHVYRFELVNDSKDQKRVYYTKDIEVVNRTSDKNGCPALPAYIKAIQGPENPKTITRYRIRVLNDTSNKVVRVDESLSRDASDELLEKLHQWVYRQNPVLTNSHPSVAYRLELIEETNGDSYVYDTYKVVFRRGKLSDFEDGMGNSALLNHTRRAYVRNGRMTTVTMLEE